MMVSPQRRTWSLVLALYMALVAGHAVAQTESRTYQLNNRPGSEIAKQVRELYQGSPVNVIARG